MGEVIAGNMGLVGVAVGLIVLVYAYFVYRGISKLPEGNDKMKQIASAIHEGAMVFLKREYRIIGLFAAIVFVLLSVFLGIETGAAYLGGALCSLIAGFCGMQAATKANVRTAQAAATEGQGKALEVGIPGRKRNGARGRGSRSSGTFNRFFSWELIFRQSPKTAPFSPRF